MADSQKPIDDIDREVEAARPSGNTISIYIDESTWNKFKVKSASSRAHAFIVISLENKCTS
jgi:uncharacterized membrane protein